MSAARRIGTAVIAAAALTASVLGMTATPAGAAGDDHTVQGTSNAATDARTLAVGETVTATATGIVYTGCGRTQYCGAISPEGELTDDGLGGTRLWSASDWGSYNPAHAASTAEDVTGVTSCPVFALLYRLGDSGGWSCFTQGVSITGDGRMLQLFMWDDHYGDNSGAWTVTLTPVVAPIVAEEEVVVPAEGCVYSHGYFKNAGKSLVSALTMGGRDYSKAEVDKALAATKGGKVAVTRHLAAFLLSNGPSFGPRHDDLVAQAHAVLAGGSGDATALAAAMGAYITEHHC